VLRPSSLTKAIVSCLSEYRRGPRLCCSDHASATWRIKGVLTFVVYSDGQSSEVESRKSRSEPLVRRMKPLLENWGGVMPKVSNCKL
jgi:hypothetical protein